MEQMIITTIITSLTSLALGYVISKLKEYIKKDKAHSNALMILLQSNLTNTYFAYEKIGEIPDYIYRNWLNELREYENLGGDDYIHVLAKKMEEFKITHTDILNHLDK